MTVFVLNNVGNAEPDQRVHLQEREIEEYLFGRLSQDAAFALEQHVSKCNGCAQELEREKQIFVTIRGIFEG